MSMLLFLSISSDHERIFCIDDMFAKVFSQHVAVLAVFAAEIARVAGMNNVASLHVFVHVT
jgi:hypothetical protein